MFKAHKVVMLPTKKESYIYFIKDKNRIKFDKYSNPAQIPNSTNVINQHLYILSDEEVKKGDIVLTDKNEILIARCFGKFSLSEKFVYPYSKKIVASTDKSLGVALIPDEFVELYCEKGSIDEVMVKYEHFLKEPDIAGGYIYTIKDGIMQGFSNTTLPIEEMHSKGYTDFFRLKVLPNNTIIAKSIKNSWNKEEVEKLCRNAWNEGYLYGSDDGISQGTDEERWIEQNL